MNNDNEGNGDTCVEHGLPGLGRAPEKGAVDYSAPIYPDQAAHALAIFKQLRIVDAPGSPTFGESCGTSGCLTWWRPVWLLRCADRCCHIKEVLSLSKKTASPRWLRDHDDGAVTELAAGGGLHHSGPDCGGGG